MSRAGRIGVFATFPDRLRELAVAAAGKPAHPGEWTTSEVVRHLIAVEDEVHVKRLRAVAVVEDPQWQWTEPGLAAGFDDADLSEVLEAFSTARAATVRLILALDEVAWARYGTHSTYGRVDVEGLLRLASDHDAEHLRGIAED